MNFYTSILGFILFFLGINAVVFAQKKAKNNDLQLEINILFGDKPLVIHQNYYKIAANDSVLITKLRFYVSNIRFYQDDKFVGAEKQSFHLIDASSKETMRININQKIKKPFNTVKLELGIDSLTNVSGAFGGDLDPTKGMYWAWQSGYINLKLEGKSSRSTHRNHEFEYHLGGYLHPFCAVQTIGLRVKTEPNQTEIPIIFDLKPFFDGIDFATQQNIMSPSAEAVLLMQKVSKLFR